MLHRPSPVVVMTTHKDDPMDLGPFLKEYVLNNPFTPTPSPPPPCPILPTKVKLEPKASNSPSARSSRSSSSPELQPVVPVAPAVVPTLLKPVTPYVLIAPAPTPESARELTYQDEDIGKLIDTPKAHIGSNASFATMLREMKLPEKHIKVKKWLLKYYRHLPNSSAWVSSDSLLRHAHKLFASLKSNVMSRIMKFTFPNCRKVINKYGYFYIGLVRKPEVEHFADKLLQTAATAVQCGHMTPEGAAKMHGVSSEMLTRMVAWQGVKEEREEEEDMVMSESGSDADHAPAPPPTPRTYLKWQLRQRSGSRVLAKMKYGSRSEAGSSSSSERNWRPRGRGRGRGRPRGSHTNNSRFLPQGRMKMNSLGAPVSNSHQEAGGIDVKIECGPFQKDNNALPSESSSVPTAVGPSIPTRSPARMSRNVQRDSIQVKEEPTDPEYNQYETGPCSCSQGELLKNGNLETRQPFAKLRRLLFSKTDSKTSKQSTVSASTAGGSTKTTAVSEASTSNGNTGSQSSTAGGRNSSLNSVVDLLTVRQELQKTKEELATKEEENLQMDSKLKEINAELKHLQKTVSHQESQMFDLASDFFELSNRFMKMSHKFKQALSDMKLPPSNSA